LKLGKEAATVAHVAEERGALRTAAENPEPKVTKQVTAADSPGRGLRRCPVCGSTQYHRTKRTTLEHLLLRPRMARFENCGLRFPYPGHRDKPSGSIKLGEAMATVPRSAEEKRAPKMAEENTQPKVTQQVTGADSSNRGLRCCPTCGSTKYQRTHRTTLEYLQLRPRMARCEKCGLRFPYPGHRDKPSGSIKLGEAMATVPRSAEEKRAPKMAEENTQPKVTQQVTGADSSNRGLRCCPTCGSMKYHRTQRTTLEHLLLHPRMARCEKCGARFPYPRHHDKSPDSVKSGEEAATVSHVGEERRASRTAEESSQPKVAKQGTAADSSNRGLRGCPVCGSPSYRRTGRTILERILLRPRMARCRDCRKRFPYPKQ